MTTLTGHRTRTISGYLITLLEYPRWQIDHDVDFTHCHLHGKWDANDDVCRQCEFGEACQWLNSNRGEPTLRTPLPDLMRTLKTAVAYMRRRQRRLEQHLRDCDCDTCVWMRDASNFLRTHRHRT